MYSGIIVGLGPRHFLYLPFHSFCHFSSDSLWYYVLLLLLFERLFICMPHSNMYTYTHLLFALLSHLLLVIKNCEQPEEAKLRSIVYGVRWGPGLFCTYTWCSSGPRSMYVTKCTWFTNLCLCLMCTQQATCWWPDKAQLTPAEDLVLLYKVPRVTQPSSGLRINVCNAIDIKFTCECIQENLLVSKSTSQRLVLDQVAMGESASIQLVKGQT